MFVRTIRGLVAAILLIAAATTVAEAQTQSASRFGISAGISSPMGDFGDFADLGFIVGGQFSTGLGERLMLRINVDFSSYGASSPGSGDVTLIGGIANILLPITTQSELKPYVLGGVGMVNAKADGSDSRTELAFNGGIGFNFNMANRVWFTEVKFVSVQTDGSSTTYLPVVLGLKF